MITLPKWLSWAGLVLLLVILFIAFFGVPLPNKYSEKALGRLDLFDFEWIATLVVKIKEEEDTAPASFDDVEAFAKKKGYNVTSVTGTDVSLSSKVYRKVFLDSMPLGRILVLGNKEDELGMLWAVTEQGLVIKVRSEKLAELGRSTREVLHPKIEPMP